MNIRASRIVGIVLFLASCGSIRAGAEAIAPPERVVRRALVEHVLDHDENRLASELPSSAGQIREAARKRLGSDLAASATAVSGMDFTFAMPGENAAALSHVGVWVFSYPEGNTALRMARNITDGHFKRTKILTAFSYAVTNDKIVIVFTESSGNGKIVDFVKSAPTLFRGETPDH
jgi:hypothetical protein